MTTNTPRVPWVWFTTAFGEAGMYCQSNILRLTLMPHKSFFSRGDTPPPAYPEGFQGNEIPIDGELVAQQVHMRLSLAEEGDD